MSNTLYRKYRPQTFADVVGQKHIVQTLESALKLGRVGQAYLFTGPRGTGKTTLARLFAKAINCSDRKKNDAEPCNHCQHCLLMNDGCSLDIIEIDAASHTGVDNIRELRETIKLPPSLGSHKVYIIDEVHMLSIGAFNALLKTLEEPPAHVIFILATTALHKVPDTIISRCQRFDLSRFPIKLIVEKLEKIATAEKLKIEKGALQIIALTAEGGMRDAESLLTQIAALDASPITEDKVIEILGTTKKENVFLFLRLIGKKELYPSLAFVRKLSNDGVDLAIFCGILLHSLRDLLLVSADPINGKEILENLTDEQKTALAECASIFSPADIVEMLEYFQIAQVGSKSSVIPELPLEIAIVKILTGNSQPTTDNIQPSQKNPDSGTDATTDVPKTDQQKNDQAQKEFTGSAATKPLAIQSALQKKSAREPDFSGNYQKSHTVKKTMSVPANPLKEEQTTVAETTPKMAGVQKNQKQPLPVSETEETTKIETAPSPVDIGIVREKWAAILNTAKTLNASLSLALSTARPITTEGATITIAVKYPFHKERLDERANQLTLTNAFDSILGSKTKLAIVLDDAPASKTQEGNATNPASGTILNPLVTQAMEILGGQVIATKNN